MFKSRREKVLNLMHILSLKRDLWQIYDLERLENKLFKKVWDILVWVKSFQAPQPNQTLINKKFQILWDTTLMFEYSTLRFGVLLNKIFNSLN